MEIDGSQETSGDSRCSRYQPAGATSISFSMSPRLFGQRMQSDCEIADLLGPGTCIHGLIYCSDYTLVLIRRTISR